jgi:transglutaminase-like putative cysteine protease
LLIRIRHLTHYRYSGGVDLGLHDIRARPRDDGAQRLRAFSLSIAPEPAGSSATNDLEGNAVFQAWFQGTHKSLAIIAQADVETFRSNPFDFIILRGHTNLPDSDLGEAFPLLRPYLTRPAIEPGVRMDTGDGADPVHTFAAEIAAGVDCRTLPFLLTLAREIRSRSDVIIRPDGSPWSPQETLHNRCGACRDLAALFIDACRCVGLAARFVSGFVIPDEDATEEHLHAWAEVFIPGGGWRGYDPTQGLAVAERHVPVAAACRPEDTAPVTGCYTGDNVRTRLTTDVSVTPIREEVCEKYL